MRDRIDLLVDPGTFVEYGRLMVAPQRKRRSFEDLVQVQTASATEPLLLDGRPIEGSRVRVERDGADGAVAAGGVVALLAASAHRERLLQGSEGRGHGPPPAEASRVAVASATAAAARSIGLRARARSYACSIVRGGTPGAGVSCAAAPAGTTPVATRARLQIRRFIVCFIIRFPESFPCRRVAALAGISVR